MPHWQRGLGPHASGKQGLGTASWGYLKFPAMPRERVHWRRASSRRHTRSQSTAQVGHAERELSNYNGSNRLQWGLKTKSNHGLKTLPCLVESRNGNPTIEAKSILAHSICRQLVSFVSSSNPKPSSAASFRNCVLAFAAVFVGSPSTCRDTSMPQRSRPQQTTSFSCFSFFSQTRDSMH